MYQKISFEDELPPENSQVAIFDKQGKIKAGHYNKGYFTFPRFDEMHPVSWYTHWLKEIK